VLKKHFEAEMIKEAQDIWLYCSYCERAFRSNSKNSCSYECCDGNLGDIWDWDIILTLNRGYPEIPVPGKEYPLYGDGSFTNLRRAGYDEETRRLPGNC
jgi:hypothetical protein